MKIAICIPHYGDVKPQFAASLAVLTASLSTTSPRYQWMLFFEDAGTLELKRIRLALKALEWGADWLLLIDSDQEFPEDALTKLLEHKQPIVGCNYPARRTGQPTARNFTGDLFYGQGFGIEKVAALGLGLCLVNAEVFRKIDHPWFASEINDQGELLVGEDVHFFNQARLAGFDVYVDNDLSFEVGHVAERVIRLKRRGNASTILSSSGAQ